MCGQAGRFLEWKGRQMFRQASICKDQQAGVYWQVNVNRQADVWTGSRSVDRQVYMRTGRKVFTEVGRCMCRQASICKDRQAGACTGRIV
jgi:hypothetical protein